MTSQGLSRLLELGSGVTGRLFFSELAVGEDRVGGQRADTHLTSQQFPADLTGL